MAVKPQLNEFWTKIQGAGPEVFDAVDMVRALTDQEIEGGTMSREALDEAMKTASWPLAPSIDEEMEAWEQIKKIMNTFPIWGKLAQRKSVGSHFKNLEAGPRFSLARLFADGLEGPRTAAEGFIPNFNQVAGEMLAAQTAGYKKPVSPGQVKSMNIPGRGKTTYNTQEKVFKMSGVRQPFIAPPSDSRAAKSYGSQVKKKFGFSPYSKRAAEGFVPNFAENISLNAESFESSTKEFEDAVAQFKEAIQGTAIDTTGLDKSIEGFSTALAEGFQADFQLQGVKELQNTVQELGTIFNQGIKGTIDFSDTLDVAVNVNVGELTTAMTSVLKDVVETYFQAELPNIAQVVQQKIDGMFGGGTLGFG